MNAQLYPITINDEEMMVSRETIIHLAREAKVTEADLKAPTIEQDTTDRRILLRTDGIHATVYKLPNDTKYGFMRTAEGQTCLASLATGMPIPADEPVMIFRAQDQLSLTAIEAYARSVENAGNIVNQMTTQSAAERFMKFCEFQREHPSRVKMPS